MFEGIATNFRYGQCPDGGFWASCDVKDYGPVTCYGESVAEAETWLFEAVDKIVANGLNERIKPSTWEPE